MLFMLNRKMLDWHLTSPNLLEVYHIPFEEPSTDQTKIVLSWELKSQSTCLKLLKIWIATILLIFRKIIWNFFLRAYCFITRTEIRVARKSIVTLAIKAWTFYHTPSVFNSINSLKSLNTSKFNKIHIKVFNISQSCRYFEIACKGKK